MTKRANASALPVELAQHLRSGEALVWWNVKNRIALQPLLWLFLVSIVVLLLVSLFAPEFWLQPFGNLWKALVVWLAPTVFVGVRELCSLRATLITDEAMIDVPQWGRTRRLNWSALRGIRRDWLVGGVQLRGKMGFVRVPGSILAEVQPVILGQLNMHSKQKNSRFIDDRVGWL